MKNLYPWGGGSGKPAINPKFEMPFTLDNLKARLQEIGYFDPKGAAPPDGAGGAILAGRLLIVRHTADEVILEVR